MKYQSMLSRGIGTSIKTTIMETQLSFLHMVIKLVSRLKCDIKAYIQHKYPYIDFAHTIPNSCKVNLSYSFRVLKKAYIQDHFLLPFREVASLKHYIMLFGMEWRLKVRCHGMNIDNEAFCWQGMKSYHEILCCNGAKMTEKF